MKSKTILLPLLVGIMSFPAWPQFGSSADVVLSWSDRILAPTNTSLIYGPMASDGVFEYLTYRQIPPGGATSQAHLLKQDGYGATRYNFVFNSSGLAYVDQVAVDPATGNAYMLVNEDIFVNKQESFDERLISVNSSGQQMLNQVVFTNPYGVQGLDLYPLANHGIYVALSEAQGYIGSGPLPELGFLHFDSSGNSLFNFVDNTVVPYSATHNPQTGALYVAGGVPTSMGGSYFGKYDSTTGANDFFQVNPNTSTTQWGVTITPDASGSLVNGTWGYLLLTNQFTVQNNETTSICSIDVFNASDQHLIGVPAQPADGFQVGEVNGMIDLWGGDTQGNNQFFESFNKSGIKTRLTSLPNNLSGVTFTPFNIAAIEQSTPYDLQQFIYSQYFGELASYHNSTSGARGIINPNQEPGPNNSIYTTWAENDTGSALNADERKVVVGAPLFNLLDTAHAATASGVSFDVTVGCNAPAGANGLKVLLTMHATGTTATFENGTTSEVVTIPAGATSTDTTVNVGTTNINGKVTIVGQGTLNTRQIEMTVLAPFISSAVPSATTVKGGAQLPVTITLIGGAGPGGYMITMTSDNPSVIPNQTLVVEQGAAQQTLYVNTNSGTTGSVHLTFKDAGGHSVKATDGQGNPVTITVN